MKTIWTVTFTNRKGTYIWETCYFRYQYFITTTYLLMFALLWDPRGKGKTLKY